MSLACPPDPLVSTAQLPQFGVPPDFLFQFRARAFQILIATGGALGTMTWQWRWTGDTAWSSFIYATSTVSPWTWTIDEAFAALSFPAGTYTATHVYSVDEAGTVTGVGPAISCTRYDLAANACSAATAEALTLMQNAVRQPLTAWGDDVRQHAASMAYAALKRSRGATPTGAGLGDEIVFIAAQEARSFFGLNGKQGRPPSILDTSITTDGPMFAAYPVGDIPRGW